MQTPSSSSRSSGSTWRKVRLWILAGALVLGLVLVFLNDQPVRTQLFFWDLEAPLFLTLALVFVFGFLGGFFLGRQTRP